MTLVWAIVIEVVQSSLPNRSADVWDVIADVAGALCALAIAHAVIQSRLNIQKDTRHD